MLLLSFIIACVDNTEKTNTQNSEYLDTATDTADSGTQDLLDVCTQESLEAVPFNDSVVTVEGYNAPFPDFTLQTTTGPWQLSSEWTGCDVYVFFNYHPDYDYPVQVWESSIDELLAASPRNTHYFFGSFNQGSEVSEVEALQTRFDERMASMSEADRAHWTNRVHFVTESIWTAESIGTQMSSRADWAFSIDGRQNLREVGYLALPTNSGWIGNMVGLAYEAQYWTAQMHQAVAIEDLGSTPYVSFDGSPVSSGRTTLSLPDASVMANYDSLHLELELECGDPLYENCGEWDYLIHAYLCDLGPNENLFSEQACDPGSAAVDGTCMINEVLGTEPCQADDDCAALVSDPTVDTFNCDGFVEAVAAETRSCDCEDPVNGVEAATQTCREDGSGFNDCACACDTEIGRWITSYARGGHWIMDSSPALAMLKEGGDREIRFQSSYSYGNTLTFHLSNQGKSGQAQQMIPLFTGGSFNENYNSAYEPVEVDVPADATRVELYAVISGHGWGAEVENCAEFCNHTHHFTVNGTEFIKEHPEAGMATGCIDQIPQGTVPNQFGTWPYGRGGWCPGKQVDPWIVDITAAVTAGQPNTISYQGLFNGSDYVPQPSNSGQGFGANINMRSYLVISQ
ncbi:MAG: peptide-N-glycosidase F-related protein [Myxococcota bacterium]|nr:peptide-N-glycosidase F-related protein [Myxococcota bacterium]MEC8381425.1 peptide-N-glycosidase F-related protein [Myxococcota bacterium]